MARGLRHRRRPRPVRLPNACLSSDPIGDRAQCRQKRLLYVILAPTINVTVSPSGIETTAAVGSAVVIAPRLGRIVLGKTSVVSTILDTTEVVSPVLEKTSVVSTILDRTYVI